MIHHHFDNREDQDGSEMGEVRNNHAQKTKDSFTHAPMINLFTVLAHLFPPPSSANHNPRTTSTSMLTMVMAKFVALVSSGSIVILVLLHSYYHALRACVILSRNQHIAKLT